VTAFHVFTELPSGDTIAMVLVTRKVQITG